MVILEAPNDKSMHNTIGYNIKYGYNNPHNANRAQNKRNKQEIEKSNNLTDHKIDVDYIPNQDVVTIEGQNFSNMTISLMTITKQAAYSKKCTEKRPLS